MTRKMIFEGKICNFFSSNFYVPTYDFIFRPLSMERITSKIFSEKEGRLDNTSFQ